ncbi:MAG: molybdopterin-guanine dinucleotide biosynthesis protein B [Candidatus Aminicenantes bacterium]|nr:molybdopterin-guanine dinucleotide biosynthesis protein B [Candidatus Aminicenantes bacterium]
MKIFSIAGWSGSGKTLLITRLIKSLKARQRRVVAVKNAPDAYALQPEAKDTAQFLHAGADEVFLIAGNELLRMSRINAPQDLLEDLKSRLFEDDIVLMEGLYQPGIPVIEVDDASRPQAQKFPLANLAAIVSAEKCSADLPCFRPDQIAEIGAFLEGYYEEHR